MRWTRGFCNRFWASPSASRRIIVSTALELRVPLATRDEPSSSLSVESALQRRPRLLQRLYGGGTRGCVE